MNGRLLVAAAALSAVSAAGAVADLGSRSPRTCVQCHSAQARPHPATFMAHAAESVAECEILRSHPVLTARIGRFSYRIERRGETSIYSVTDGSQTLTVPIGWALGLGNAGQTYVYQYNGALYESFVSYFKAIDGLDITIGDQPLHPENVTDAAGRRMGDREMRLCFDCHTTNAVDSGNLNLSGLTPGIQCERCHGPVDHHLAGIASGNAKAAAMPSIKFKTAEEASQFCGQCHRTWEQIATGGPHGTSNVRFQPYRLANSKCYDIDDLRISCTACHNPHQQVDVISAHYDTQCLACHGGGKPGAKACTVGKQDCASCHMPKVDLPGAHHRFTDHNIRIAKGPYPD